MSKVLTDSKYKLDVETISKSLTLIKMYFSLSEKQRLEFFDEANEWDSIRQSYTTYKSLSDYQPQYIGSVYAAMKRLNDLETN